MTRSDPRREKQREEFGDELRTIFAHAKARGVYKNQADLAKKSQGQLSPSGYLAPSEAVK